MNHRKDETMAHQAADVVDDAARTVRQVAGRAVDAVQDTYEKADEYVRDSLNRGRDKARSWENSFESSVRDNPKTALLIAAACGVILASWWKRK